MASNERRVAQALEEAPGRLPTERGSAHRDNDTKYDLDYCHKKNGLQKRAEARGGKEPLRQRSLNEKIQC